jgi:hypothetical protein
MAQAEQRHGDTRCEPLWRGIGWIILVYTALTAILTYPVVLHPSALVAASSRNDVFLALYMFRTWMHALASGRLPLFCSDINWPVGIPFAATSLFQYQTAVYLLLHPLCNTTLIFNILFFSPFVLAGLGAYLLAKELLGDTRASFLAGLVYAFGAPHSLPATTAHVTTFTLQWIPFFLLFWIRLIKMPNWKNLVLSILFYVMAACSDPYQIFFCTLLGGLYLLFHALTRPRKGISHFLVLAKWLYLFSVATLLVLIPLFEPLLWQFRHFGSMTWGPDIAKHSVHVLAWVVPSRYHVLHRICPISYPMPYGPIIACSYHGVFAIFFSLVAIMLKPRFRERAYCIVSFGVCVFAAWAPALVWRGHCLWTQIPLLRQMRSPNRFNVAGSLMYALLTAAGFAALRHYGTLRCIKKGYKTGRSKRWGTLAFVVLVGLMSMDLSIAPYRVSKIPDMPDFFRTFPAPQKGEGILELPICGSGSPRYGLSNYWQSYHRWPTSAYYMACTKFGRNMVWRQSPFCGVNYHSEGNHPFKDIVAWDCKAFLLAHHVRYVVQHISGSIVEESDEIDAVCIERMQNAIQTWMYAPPIYSDASILVYDPARIETSRNPAFGLGDGFTGILTADDRAFRCSEKCARVTMFASTSCQGSITIVADSPSHPRKLRVTLDGLEIGNWQIPIKTTQFRTKSVQLNPGVHEVLLLHGEDTEDNRGRAFRFYQIDWAPSKRSWLSAALHPRSFITVPPVAR